MLRGVVLRTLRKIFESVEVHLPLQTCFTSNGCQTKWRALGICEASLLQVQGRKVEGMRVRRHLSGVVGAGAGTKGAVAHMFDEERHTKSLGNHNDGKLKN